MVTPTDTGATAGPPLPWIDRLILRGARRPDWAAVVGVLVVLAAAWGITYVAGGSHTAMPHLFYIPIIASTIRFRFRGAIPTAVVAGVLVGPLMPLYAATGEPQTVASWVVRTVLFLVVGAAFAAAMTIRERVAEHDLAAEVRDAMLAESTAHTEAEADGVDPEVAAVLPQVLADRAFHCVYQPIYSLSDGRLVAFEALTRFDAEPQRPPDVWFDAAGQVGLGVELELAAVELAVAGATSLPANVLLAVNASPQTLADPRLAAILEQNPGRLVGIEVTEHVAVTDYRTLTHAVAELRGRGADIAVDDAGAGFASLRHIIHLAPDTIKVDISLTQGVGSSPLKRALAEALVAFAGASKAFIVAEGVEHPEDLVTWANLGATAVQGYLTGRPGDIVAAPPVSEVVLALTRGARIPAQPTPRRGAGYEPGARHPAQEH